MQSSPSNAPVKSCLMYGAKTPWSWGAFCLPTEIWKQRRKDLLWFLPPQRRESRTVKRGHSNVSVFFFVMSLQLWSTHFWSSECEPLHSTVCWWKCGSEPQVSYFCEWQTATFSRATALALVANDSNASILLWKLVRFCLSLERQWLILLGATLIKPIWRKRSLLRTIVQHRAGCIPAVLVRQFKLLLKRPLRLWRCYNCWTRLSEYIKMLFKEVLTHRTYSSCESPMNRL